jgi:hypothetical protein
LFHPCKSGKLQDRIVQHLPTIPLELIDGLNDFCFEVDIINIKTSHSIGGSSRDG